VPRRSWIGLAARRERTLAAMTARAHTWVGTAVLVAMLAACTGEDSAPTTPPSTGSEVVTTTSVADDGLLTLAVLVPQTGRGAQLGLSLQAGAQTALEAVNEAGGVGGRPVRLIVRPESDDPGQMIATIRDLVEIGVDGFVGPASSTVALATMRTIIDSGAVACSPTASALALDDLPDDGRFFRTIPSDSLQAVAIARLVEQSGATRVALAALDDDYGRPLGAAVASALAAAGVSVVAQTEFVGTDRSTRDAAEELVEADPDVVVVTADADSGALLISATSDLAPLTEFVVNDAQRVPEQERPFLLGRVTGVSPAASVTDVAFTDAVRATNADAPGWYAASAYDCVTVLALAAAAAGSTQPADIGGAIRSVTVSGTRCSTFDECITQQERERNINYDGPDGVLDVGADGDPVRARFEVFGFDGSGVDQTLSSFVVTR
jgi:branched-chain amino acid transport system substrate-binding protein